MYLRELALGTLTSEIGTEEIGDSNYSPRIEEYFASLDPPIPLVDTDGDGQADEGYPYCAATVMFAIRRTCERYGVLNPMEPVVREAYVQDWYDYCDERGFFIPKEEAAGGDIVMYRFGQNPTRWNHIGLVFHGLLLPDSEIFRAVEGNTSPPDDLPGQSGEAQREGNGVWAKDREFHIGRVVFARWDEGIEIENP